ncbi:MAG TPA: OBAP family protein [Rhodocyclaceae bacterium]|nr:OBAP family protein [Rhodocyclaceae bacterium]
MSNSHRSVPVILAAAALAGACHESGPQVSPEGAAKSTKTKVLEAGAKVLQSNSPLAPLDIYLSGFHAMKADPQHQMEAHHYCRQVNEDFAQCVLFDGNTRDANLNGIEYIISEKLFEALPEQERQFWHPHNYEILSGQLAAPNIPGIAEKELMRGKMNSYGKTWHIWNTGVEGRPGDKLPLGEPMLAWSLNRDGELHPGLVESRDRRMGLDSLAKRRERADLATRAHPQAGVDALKGKFGPDTRDLPGVRDKGAAGPAR